MDKYTSNDIAKLLGIKLPTWRSYVSRGHAPKADGYINSRTPFWYPTTIQDWLDNRPGYSINRVAYSIAQLLIEADAWKIDPDTGIVDAPGISICQGYLVIQFRYPDQGKFYSVNVSRVVWEYENGPIPEQHLIDHKNRIRHDNRIDNLRLATPIENSNNRTPIKLPKSNPTDQ